VHADGVCVSVREEGAESPQSKGSRAVACSDQSALSATFFRRYSEINKSPVVRVVEHVTEVVYPMHFRDRLGTAKFLDSTCKSKHWLSISAEGSSNKSKPVE